MKLIAGIYNNKQLKTLAPYVDGVVLMVPHYAYVYEDLDISGNNTIKVKETEL